MSGNIAERSIVFDRLSDLWAETPAAAEAYKLRLQSPVDCLSDSAERLQTLLSASKPCLERGEIHT